MNTYCVGTLEELNEGGGKTFLTYNEAKAYVDQYGDSELCISEITWTFEDKQLVHEPDEEESSEYDEESEDDSWRRERAMLVGMTHGTQGYNEVMGYDEQEFSCYSCHDRGCDRCYDGGY